MLIGYFCEYQGYKGTIEYDQENGYYGKIHGIKDLVNYEASNVEKLYEMFQEAVDDYLQFSWGMKGE